MRLVPNDLETRRFGVRFARLTFEPESPEELLAILADADASGLDVITTRVRTRELGLIHHLEGAGFRLMDTLVYYRCTLPVLPHVASVAVVELAAESARTCALLAGRAFHKYVGHYHADPRLPDAAADAAYADWAERLIESPVPGQISLGAVSGETIVGFLIGVPHGNRSSEIVLNAVDPSTRRQGFYRTLLRHYQAIAAARGDREVVVSTQIDNLNVQTAWARSGFMIAESYYTFHRWSS